MTERLVRMRTHIRDLWKELYRHTENVPAYSTLLPLPFPYILPGGRFREIYYWDSYFTFLGLVRNGHLKRIEEMIANFAHLIDVYGHIPNGNRVYYLTRSQPPFFCCMLQLLEQQKGFLSVSPYLSQLIREYNYWMSGINNLTEERRENSRVVRLEGTEILNRYWDESNNPRPEAYREDQNTYQNTVSERRENLYRNLRAVAESGWDFSSRWLQGEQWSLTSIRTTEIIPVDLNCLIFNIERQLASWCAKVPKVDESISYQVAAEQRRQAILKYCWNDEQGWFCDYAWFEEQRSEVLSLAGVFPLFFKIALPEQAAQIAARIERDFLKAGGVVTTLHYSGQQWDAPNGWAPLQWITVQGLLNYGYVALAQEIARRFVTLAADVYEKTGLMMEKYNVCELDCPASDGEYPTQRGFGWTHGVVEALADCLNLLMN